MKVKIKKRVMFFSKIIQWFDMNRKQINAIPSFLLSVISFIIVVISLIISIQSYRISEIALKQSSSITEPLLSFDIDYWNDTVNVKNETADIFQIYHVNFGRVQAIAIKEINDQERYSILALEDRLQSMNLEHGHTTGTDTSDEDAVKYNKSFDLSLADNNSSIWAMRTNNTEFIENLENRVIQICDTDDKYEYLDISPYYDFRFIEVYYMDAYKNRSSQYYVYVYEYAQSWRLYKLTEEEYIEYVEDVMVIRRIEDEEQRLLDYIFNQNNFEIDLRIKYKFVDYNAPKYDGNKINNKN